MAIPSPGYWHVSSVGWTAVAAWAALTPYTVGQMVRQLAGVAVGGERVFICIVAGTSLAAEPTWNTTKGSTAAEALGPTWQECTGQAFGNGNLRDTSAWTLGPTGGTGVKGQAVALGYVIKRDNAASYQICTTAGTAGAGAEPSFSDTAGVTTADNTITWTSLGAVGNFTTAFGNPSATLEFAYLATWGAAGDIFYIADNHAQTRSTALTLTSPGTNALPCSAYCVDRTKVEPAAADVVAVPTGQLTTTGNSNLTIGGAVWYQGLIFNAGTGAVTAIVSISALEVYFKTCSLRKLGTTASTSAISLNSNLTVLDNTSVRFGATGDRLALVGIGVWKNTSAAILGATFPATLMVLATSAQWVVDGVDLSALASGQTIASAGQLSRMTLNRVKLGASAVIGATPTFPGILIDAIQCDSGATNYTQARFAYQGTLTQETTIVRSGGASDGTTPISWKLVSTANAKWVLPFESFPIAIWNDTVGSPLTATLEIVAAGALNTDDVWIEVEYLGSTLTPQASFANGTKANNLATGTALAVSTATWASSPGAAQQLTAVFTPQMKGYIYVRVYVGLASQTVYVDPKVALS